jgi:CRP-like cAMP-binding protein
MESLKSVLKGHAFFKGLKDEYINEIAACGEHAEFKAGQLIFEEQAPADSFFIIRKGLVAIETVTGQDSAITIQTVGKDNILGWSWLIPPHRARFNCRAVEDTTAIRFDGKKLRDKCEKNTGLGYELLKRLAVVFTQRLEETRRRLLDIYGNR